ncbi:hypothetical protein LZ023_36040 (plasmid) [Pseudomonas silvicola]|nr:hypothetical protein LZ023_36040 [Pseudomonas silvicola]
MAQRYKLGVVQGETVAEISAAIEARNIPPVRAMSGIEIKAVRLRWKMSQAALA